jgi:hypothetical protein
MVLTSKKTFVAFETNPTKSMLTNDSLQVLNQV